MGKPTNLPQLLPSETFSFCRTGVLPDRLTGAALKDGALLLLLYEANCPCGNNEPHPIRLARALKHTAVTPNRPAQPEIRPISAGEVAQREKYTLEVLESQYKLAEAVNDVGGMEAALAAALKILWEVAKGYAKVQQAKRPEKLVEWEEFDRAVNEAMSRAQTLRTHFRRLTRDDLTQLREAPTPGARSVVMYRFATRVVPRPVRTTRK